MDPPGWLLAAAVATLPDHRREWGMAMRAELAEVLGGSARWQFALSSARAVLRLPLLGGWPALTLVTGVVAAAVAAAAPAVEAAVPGLGVFAVSLVGLVGAMVVLAVARSRRMRLPVPAATVLVTGGVATAITMTVIFLLRDPAAARYLPPANAVFLAAVLAGCVDRRGGAAVAEQQPSGTAPRWTRWRPCGSGSGRPPSSSSQRSRPGRPGGRSGRACRPASGRASPPCRSPTPFGCTRRCACTRSTAGCCGSSAALPKART